jgi:hypothetical protein
MEPCEQPIVSLSNPSHASISLMMVPDNDMQTAQSPLTYLLWIFISHDLWLLWMLFTQQYILHLLLDYTIIAEQYPAAPCVQLCASHVLLPCVCQPSLCAAASLSSFSTGYRLTVLLGYGPTLSMIYTIEEFKMQQAVDALLTSNT